MAHECIFSRSGYFGRSEWALDERALLLSPQGLPTEVYPIREIAGISGDGYTIQLSYGGDALTLSRLGDEGPRLVEALRRTWPLLRARALSLGGSVKPTRFATNVMSMPPAMPEEQIATAPAPAASVACEALLYDDVLLVARDGHDLEPLFLSDFSDITFDDSRYAARCHDWSGAVTIFSGLAGETEEFVRELRAGREALSREADEILADRLPSLPTPTRAALAARWLPGRLVALEQLETLAPGVTQALTDTWVSALPRREEAAVLTAWAEPGELYLGFTRGGRSDVAAGPEVWLLAARGDRWFMENLSADDHLTYRFQGDSRMPHLAGRLLCAPQFSREALYLPLEQLTGGHADLAIAARDLGFLRQLRGLFQGRLVYTTPQAWQAGLDG